MRGPSVRKVRAATLARTTGGRVLSREVEELLFAHATVLTEARVDDDGYAGSTMFTVDVEALAPHVRHPGVAPLASELLTLAESSVRVRLRAMRFACAEAARRVPERSLSTCSTETRMRLHDQQLLIDVDVSAAFLPASSEAAK